jgi:lysophospholipase L1-like esterase
MTRKTLIHIVAILALTCSVIRSTVPAGAAPPQAVDPAQLALPQSALPADTAVDFSGASDNADADSSNNPLHGLHPSNSYASLGRVTGYREQLHLTVGGNKVATAYLASVFATPDQAKAALNDALNLVSLIGSPLAQPCTAGELCKAYSGPNGSSTVVYSAFTRGPILVELASSTDTSSYSQVAPSLQSALYALLAAADTQVQHALGGSTTPVTTPAATPTATPTPATPVVPHNPKLGSYYLAIGDSFSLGYLTGDRPVDPQCKAPDAPGFVCVFYRYLAQLDPRIQLNNLSEGGADSCELAGAGHRCYETQPLASPVDAAVQFLNAHPGQVDPITVTVGGDDLLALLPQAVSDLPGTLAKLPGIMTRYRTNLDTILSRVRAAAPDAEIIVTTQPNSVGGLGSPPLPAGLPVAAKNAIDNLNGIMKAEAPKYGAVIADSAAAFDANPGGAAQLTWVPTYLPQGRFEIHPTPEGYRVYGQAVIKASGYLPTVTARLAHKQVKPGKSQQVRGATAAKATVQITVWSPHQKQRTVSATSDGAGSFSKAFKVGTASGKGAVRICVSLLAGQSVCTSRMSYTIR